MTDADNGNEVKADDVAAWLKANPDFFMDHSDVFTAMRVPHPEGDHAISMVERQLISLRERNAKLEKQLGELIGFGQHNDNLIEKLHRLTLALLRATDAEMTLAVVHESLRSDFAIPFSTTRWWGEPISAHPLEAANLCSSELKSYVAGLDRPYVGPNAAHESRGWLGAGNAEAQSFAYVPLLDGGVSGVLMLASDAPERFTPDMATDVLTRLAHLTSAALGRFAMQPAGG
ncbi:MAG: DUF484 family protein [Casimicrobium sp.]|jgi:uncharacterized protein YigA (DUF484 family)